MRVHLRGIVLGVAVLLVVVIAISVFNAMDNPPEPKQARSSSSSEEEGEEGTGRSSSRTSPRSSTRLRPQGGPRGPRAGGPGSRAGGGPWGAGRAGGGPGGRAGGPRAQAARMGVDDDEDNDDEMEIDETPEEEVVEVRPRGNAGSRNRPGGMAARARSTGADADDQPRNPPMRSRPGSMAGRARSMGTDDDDDEQPKPRGNPSFRNRPGGKAARAQSQEKDEEDEDDTNKEEEKEKEKEKKKEKEEEDKKEEEKPAEPPKKEPPYPEWWKASYARSAVSSLESQFVGDQPLYPECPNFDAAGSVNFKMKRYSFVEPPSFLKNSRNPCWFEWTGKKDMIKCLPFFYIAGAPKSGTVDLFRRVHGHPNIMEGGAPTYFWWDRLRYGAPKALKYTRENRRSDDPVQLKEYSKNIVGKHGKNITKEVLYSGESISIFGDATPTYLTENTQWDVFEGNEGCSEPRIIPATFIRHVYPQARVVLVLRNPVERLYSRFLANVPYVHEYENHTNALFHTFVTKAVQMYRECFSRMSVRHCAYNSSLYSSSVVRLSEGMYSVFVEDWLRVFDKEQILIFKFEDYITDVHNHITKVFSHLGVDPIDDVNVLKLAELPVIRKGKTREEKGYMLPETVSLLLDFYEPFNLRLAQLLDDEKWILNKEEIILPPPAPPVLPPGFPEIPSLVVGMNAQTAPVAPVAPVASETQVAAGATGGETAGEEKKEGEGGETEVKEEEGEGEKEGEQAADI